MLGPTEEVNMAKSPEQMIAMMVDAAQPHCDEPLQSAMICSHAGSMKNLFAVKLSGFGGGPTRTSELPSPLIIAVGQDTVYAFKYKPRGFKIKIKKGSEAARWRKDAIHVESGSSGGVSDFAIVTDSGDIYALEVTTALGGAEAFNMFIATLPPPPPGEERSV
jgi:hypothetical protein